MFDYDDDFPPCLNTYLVLRVTGGELKPAKVSELLGLEPTKSAAKGDKMPVGTTMMVVAEKNLWMYSTRGLVNSKDSRRHIDWLLDKLAHKEREIEQLKQGGATVVISNWWESSGGAGGPILNQKQMLGLTKLGIDIYWDVRFPKPTNN
jgi:hypothetical protein